MTERRRNVRTKQRLVSAIKAIATWAGASRTAYLFLIQPSHEKQAFLRLILQVGCLAASWLQTQFEEPSGTKFGSPHWTHFELLRSS
jgi:hypothetical protein